MDLRVSIIDDEHKLNKILESTNLDDYELIGLPMKQSGDLSHKHTRRNGLHFGYSKYMYGWAGTT